MSVHRVKPVISNKMTVEVWRCDVDLLDEVDLGIMRGMLAPPERARNDSFLVEKPRRLHAAAYALARQALGMRLAVAPDRIALGRTALGKPFLIDPPRPLAFNIAHSGSLATCVLAEASAVGIDVEPVDRPELTAALLDGMLAPAERARLRSLAGLALQEALVALWTGKEAVAKAHGGGLSLPLELLVIPEADGPVAMDAIFGTAPAAWSLYRLRPDYRHRIAVALHADPDVAVEIVSHDATALFRDRRARAARAGSA
jgi:4'-phosphopantetheinyl transferase